MKWLSTLVDKASDYFAHRKGLLPLLGILLIIVNFLLPFFMQSNFLTASNLFLHLGIIIAIFGLMLAWAL
jgi:membrane-bound ClpP family serine protease